VLGLVEVLDCGLGPSAGDQETSVQGMAVALEMRSNPPQDLYLKCDADEEEKRNTIE